METAIQPFGDMVRGWRQRRRVSQLALAGDVPTSQRHLSFLESGRARPSRDMVSRLAEALDLPPRAENELFLAAGFAPARGASPLDAPALAPVRAAALGVIRAADPCPGLVVDRHWTLVEANEAAGRLMAGVAPALLSGPVNVLRLSLHPEGLAGRILNFREWRGHIAARLARDAELSGDGALAALRDEVLGYPVPAGARPGRVEPPNTPEVAIPLSIATPAGVLNLISATTVFGTAVDVTAAELVIECFYPAGAADRAVLEALAAG